MLVKKPWLEDRAWDPNQMLQPLSQYVDLTTLQRRVGAASMPIRTLMLFCRAQQVRWVLHENAAHMIRPRSQVAMAFNLMVSPGYANTWCEPRLLMDHQDK